MENINMFDLFNDSNAIPEELKSVSEQKKVETKKANKETKKDVNKEVKLDDKYDLPLIVRYAFQNITLDADNFGGLEKVTLEEVREYLEEDYPELSKDRTVMEYDIEKNIIIPILRGSRKG